MSTQTLQKLGFGKKVAFSNIHFLTQKYYVIQKMLHKTSIHVIRENTLQPTIRIFAMGTDHKTKENRLADNVNFTQMILI